MAGALFINPACCPQEQKTRCCEDAEDQGRFLRKGIEELPVGQAGESRERANCLRSLRNLATQRTSIPLAARSGRLPRDRTRKPAQDAASRNIEVTDRRLLRRAESLTNQTAFQGPVGKKTAQTSADYKFSTEAGSACDSKPEAARLGESDTP
jgi:hypothetical protein